MNDTSTSLDEQPPIKDGIFVRRGLAEVLEPALAVWWRAESARRHGPPPSASVERVCGYARRTGVFLLGAESTGEVASMALVTPATSRSTEIAVVQMVFVAPERWGEGIGGRLNDAALAEARVRGFERALLWTHADDERVRRLYEGRGFGRTGPRVAGESSEPIVRYERPL
jgi:GNAT superfamily N-acetyltransferase